MNRNNFKQTEIGLIPKDWEVESILKSLKEKRFKVGKIKQKDYKKAGKYPVIDQGNNCIAGYSDDKDKVYDGDLPVAIFGDHTRIVKYIDFPFIVGADGVKILLPKKDLFETKFFFYALSDLKIQSRGYNRHFPILKEKKIPVPPIPEQKQIVRVLSKIQQAIEKQENIIEAAKNLKKSLMQKLFTFGISPGYHLSGRDLGFVDLKETEVGLMPRSWKVMTLGDICDYTTGKLNSEAAKKDGMYPFFTCSQETYAIDSYSFNQEALLLAGNNARGIYSVKHYKGKFDAYQRTYVLTIKDAQKVSYSFLVYELSRKLDVLRQSSLGTTTKYLTAGIIKNLQVSVPTVEEQKEIAYILSTIDKKIEAEEKRKTTLKELFKTMLHKLMTGEIRLKDIEV